MLEQLESSDRDAIITLYDVSWEKFEAIAFSQALQPQS